MPDVSGVVVVNKPSGPTSFDVVRRVKGLFKVKRVGHTGTLDPTATGVLPICVGAATKVAGFIAEGEKEYEATVRFGQRALLLENNAQIVMRLGEARIAQQGLPITSDRLVWFS